MPGVERTNPYEIPRPYPMVARLLAHRERARTPLTAERVRQLEQRAIRKLAIALQPLIAKEF